MPEVAPSFNDLIALGIAEAQFKRPDLKFRDGDVSEAQVHASAVMADANIRYAAQLFRNTFLDGAKGDALTALVSDSINQARQVATQAVGSVQFTRVAGTGPAGSIPLGTKVGTTHDADGNQIVFTTDTAIAFALDEVGPKSVNVTAVVAGPDGSVSATNVNQVIDSLFDQFTVNNPADMAGGNPFQSDAQLREFARVFWITLRKGTLKALEQGALNVPEVRVAIAVEDEVTGDVTVRVTDENGNSNLQMINDVEAELEDWRAAGVPVNVIGGSTLTVDIVVQLDEVGDGFSVAAATPTIVAAVEAVLNKRRVGETQYLDQVTAVVIAVSPDEIEDISFPSITVGGVPMSPVGDIVPTTIQLIRPGTITVQAGS